MPPEMSGRPAFNSAVEDPEVPELLPADGGDHQSSEMAHAAAPLLMSGVGAMCGPAPSPHQPWVPPQYQQQSFPQTPHGYPYPYGYRYPPYDSRYPINK